MTKLKITKKKNPKLHETTDEMKGKLTYWGQESQKNTKTRKTQVGIHYLGPTKEKHKNTQNTKNTLGHILPYNEPHMLTLPFDKFKTLTFVKL